MDFEKLKQLWEQDAKIDHKSLDTESLNIPKLHSKWYNILIECKLEYKKQELAYAREKVKAKSYYAGDYGPDDKRFKSLGAQPRKLKAEDMNDYVAADSELQKIKLLMFLSEEKIEFVLNILNQINNRSFQISNAIKWSKFMQGIND